MNKTKLLLAISLATASLSTFAAETPKPDITVYPGANCSPATSSEKASVNISSKSFDVGALTHTDENQASGETEDLLIICPIPKSYTPNLTITTEIIANIDYNTAQDQGSNINCQLVTNSGSSSYTPHTSGGGEDILSGQYGGNTNAYISTLVENESDAVSLVCNVPNNNAITSYIVTEQEEGLDQGNVQSPWSTNVNGQLFTGQGWNYTMGYHFTPEVNGKIIDLGGFFSGTKDVSLWNKATGELLAKTQVTSNYDFNYSSIDPVAVEAGVTYTVGATMNGSGGSYRNGVQRFPISYGDITIEGSTYTSGNARPTNSNYINMYGQADINFVAD